MKRDDVFKIIPCKADKTPLIRNWQQLATNDPKQIRLWQELFRDQLAYWGIPTGQVNDLLVLDVDVKGDGFKTIQTLPIPETMSQRTRSGASGPVRIFPRRASGPVGCSGWATGPRWARCKVPP